MNQPLENNLDFQVRSYVEFLYPTHDVRDLTSRLLAIMNLEGNQPIQPGINECWSEKDTWLITYGDSLLKTGEKPLMTLENFLKNELEGIINGVHILPFFPYSSDDGFSVIDYKQVSPKLGDWDDIMEIASNFRVMSDLVINHCSSESEWFRNYKKRRDPGKDYFFEASPDDDLSQVVRPRTSPLLQEVETNDGTRYVWCTFSHDQIDLNFTNPEVLVEFVRIIRFYLDRGIRIFRLDAVAFIWKEPGTSCIHLPQTHMIIRLLRTLIEHHVDEAILITETNVPNHENLSYFGNSNEAHAVYNFSLPPLILHALISGTSKYLRTWQMSMPPALMGTFYFNFVASHDGIGLRPAEGLLEESEIMELVETMKRFDARVSWRTSNDGTQKPYEINSTFYDALQGTSKGPDEWQLERFLCSQAIMLALEGIPGIYIHSLLGTENNHAGVAETNHNRTINRYKWPIDALVEKLSNPDDHHCQVFQRMKELIRIRTRQPAFNPNTVQFTLQLGDDVFGFWRQSRNREQSIFCLHNVTDHEIGIPLSSINLISFDTWVDLVGGEEFDNFRHDLVLKPYQCMWLSNKAY
jgi:sucrose phosphorylase